MIPAIRAALVAFTLALSALVAAPTAASAAVAETWCSVGSAIPGNPGVRVRAWYSGETPVEVDKVEVLQVGGWGSVDHAVLRPTIRTWGGALEHNLADRAMLAGDDSILWNGTGTWNVAGIRARVRVDVEYERLNGQTVNDTCVALLQ